MLPRASIMTHANALRINLALLSGPDVCPPDRAGASRASRHGLTYKTCANHRLLMNSVKRH
eukprot:SAG31_NODE_2648_length_5299_cov_7.289615_2_plen_61_part_00